MFFENADVYPAAVASLSPKSNRKSLAARIRRRYSVSGGWREATIENTCAFPGCIRCDTYRQLTLFENKCSFALMLFICRIINYTGTVEPLYNSHFGDRRKRPLWRGLNMQRAKKVVSDSLGLVDFAIRLVNSDFNLPDGQVIFFYEFE